MENNENQQNTIVPERETNTITLVHCGAIVVYYSYIKAREIRDLSKSDDGQKFLIEKLIVSMDGSHENIYERVMDLRYEEYKQIDDALLGLVKLSDEKKN